MCARVCVCTLSSSQGDTPSLHPPNAGAHLHRYCRRLHLQQIENTSFSNLLKDSDFWASIVFVFHCDICAHRTRGYEWRQNKHNHSYYEAYKIKRHNDLTYTLNLYYEHVDIMDHTAGSHKTQMWLLRFKICESRLEKNDCEKRGGRRRISWIFSGFKKDQCVQNPKIGPERARDFSGEILYE